MYIFHNKNLKYCFFMYKLILLKHINSLHQFKTHMAHAFKIRSILIEL